MRILKGAYEINHESTIQETKTVSHHHVVFYYSMKVFTLGKAFNHKTGEDNLAYNFRIQKL